MMFDQLSQDLQEQIIAAYTEGVTVVEAERLAAKCLHAMQLASDELKICDLDARMRKSGLKAIKAAVYLEACQKEAKKPSDVMLDHMINTDGNVGREQDALDNAEVNRDGLERYHNTFLQAHIYFRGIAKGRFEG